MRLKVLTSLLLLLSFLPASFAGEGHRMALSLSPYLGGGIMGIKDTSYSPLAYNGPHARIGFCFLAQGAKANLFVDASGSFGWLGNRYHRDAPTMQLDLSVGSLADVYGNQVISLKAGGALGVLRNDQYIRLPDTFRFHYTLAFDAEMCISAAWKLPHRWSVLIENRLPVVAFISPSNRLSDSRPDIPFDYSFKAFPGNDMKVGVCRTLQDRNSLMLSVRHYCYSSGQVLPDLFQLQFLELCIDFRFSLFKH